MRRALLLKARGRCRRRDGRPYEQYTARARRAGVSNGMWRGRSKVTAWRGGGWSVQRRGRRLAEGRGDPILAALLFPEQRLTGGGRGHVCGLACQRLHGLLVARAPELHRVGGAVPAGVVCIVAGAAA